MSQPGQSSEVTPQLLLKAYSIGLFPMAESVDDPNIFWVDPEYRGIFPLDQIRISRSLAKRVRSDRFSIKVDHDFDAVIEACAQSKPNRDETWINARIRTLYSELFNRGFVHTIEVYNRAGELIGGLYGVRIGSAFFGESMFHTETDASKIALIHLVARLRYGGFTLLDTQFVTPHLISLGAVEISRDDYHRLLDSAIGRTAEFYKWPQNRPMSGQQALDLVRA